jgi:SH3-like domain-containing protein
MTAFLRCALVAFLVFGALPAAAQSALGGAGSLPPPQRPGGGAAPATSPPAAPAPPRAAPAAAPRAPASAPPPPQAAAPAPVRPAAPRAAPVLRPPDRPDARPRSPSASEAARQRGEDPARRRAAPAAGAAAAGAGAAGAAAGAAAMARPAEPAAPAPAPEPQPSVGSVTNLPLPRFAALRSDEVNLRAGPGTRFPIEWTYQRRELPVMITREFELWRRIRDPEGTEGWVHQSTLMGRRSAIVRVAPEAEAVLRRRPEDEAPPVARLRSGVILRLRRCDAGSAWCEAQVGEHRGFIRRAELWGVTAEEELR